MIKNALRRMYYSPQYVFLYLALIFGAVFLALIPIFGYNPDELFTHFNYAFSGIDGITTHSNTLQDLQITPSPGSNDTIDYIGQLLRGNHDFSNTVDLSNNYFPGFQIQGLAWFVQSLGIWVGATIYPSILVMYKMGALFNLILFVVVTFFCIKTINKRSNALANIVLFIAFFQTVIKDACTLSYDTITNCFMLGLLTLILIFYHSARNRQKVGILPYILSIILPILTILANIKPYTLVVAPILLICIIYHLYNYYNIKDSKYCKRYNIGIISGAVVVLVLGIIYMLPVVRLIILNEHTSTIMSATFSNPVYNLLSLSKNTIGSIFIFQKIPYGISTIIVALSILLLVFLSLHVTDENSPKKSYFTKTAAIAGLIAFIIVWNALSLVLNTAEYNQSDINNGNRLHGFDGRYLAFMVLLLVPLVSVIGTKVCKSMQKYAKVLQTHTIDVYITEVLILGLILISMFAFIFWIVGGYYVPPLSAYDGVYN